MGSYLKHISILCTELWIVLVWMFLKWCCLLTIESKLNPTLLEWLWPTQTSLFLTIITNHVSNYLDSYWLTRIQLYRGNFRLHYLCSGRCRLVTWLKQVGVREFGILGGVKCIIVGGAGTGLKQKIRNIIQRTINDEEIMWPKLVRNEQQE